MQFRHSYSQYCEQWMIRRIVLLKWERILEQGIFNIRRRRSVLFDKYYVTGLILALNELVSPSR